MLFPMHRDVLQITDISVCESYLAPPDCVIEYAQNAHLLRVNFVSSRILALLYDVIRVLYLPR